MEAGHLPPKSSHPEGLHRKYGAAEVPWVVAAAVVELLQEEVVGLQWVVVE